MTSYMEEKAKERWEKYLGKPRGLTRKGPCLEEMELLNHRMDILMGRVLKGHLKRTGGTLGGVNDIKEAELMLLYLDNVEKQIDSRTLLGIMIEIDRLGLVVLKRSFREPPPLPSRAKELLE